MPDNILAIAAVALSLWGVDAPAALSGADWGALVERAPAEFDHPITDPQMVLVIEHVDPADVDATCRRGGSYAYVPRTSTIRGCASIRIQADMKIACIITMPHPQKTTAGAYDALYRHERAHCNGWRHPAP